MTTLSKQQQQALDASLIDIVHSLGTMRSITAVQWDALGEHLVVQFQAGSPARPTVPVVWSVPRALVVEMHCLLGQVLGDTSTAEMPMQ